MCLCSCKVFKDIPKSKIRQSATEKQCTDELLCCMLVENQIQKTNQHLRIHSIHEKVCEFGRLLGNILVLQNMKNCLKIIYWSNSSFFFSLSGKHKKKMTVVYRKPHEAHLHHQWFHTPKSIYRSWTLLLYVWKKVVLSLQREAAQNLINCLK